MLPEECQQIEADEVVITEQYLQPYFEHLLWSELCCKTCVERAYMNIIEKKLVCGECHRTKLTFFESEIRLSLEFGHIAKKDFYHT